MNWIAASIYWKTCWNRPAWSLLIAKACRKLALAVPCLFMVACVTQHGLEKPGSQPAARMLDHTAAARSAAMGREKAIMAYRDYLARYPDGPEHDRITRRLADLLVEQAADLQLLRR
jgi:hypothetical protein